MSRWTLEQHERALELAAAQALGAVNEADSRELATFEGTPEFAALCEDMERAAAAVDVGSWRATQQMPAGLKNKLAAAGESWSAGQTAARAPRLSAAENGRNGARVQLVEPTRDVAGTIGKPSRSAEGVRRGRWAGWLVAAAAIGVATVGWWPRLTGIGSVPGAGVVKNPAYGPATSGEAMAMLRQQNANIQRIAWAKGTDASASIVEGEVLWSPEVQQGYMVFRGLRVNDPTKEQYQLWIFDAERDERYPVDGALFDVPIGCNEVVVKISPKLSVPKAATFVVTVEKPGGVWVSDRSRIATIAKKS
jgi:hypothetical protein